MAKLTFDLPNNAVRIELEGRLTMQEIHELNELTLAFARRWGAANGILDLGRVESIGLDRETIVALAREPPIMRGMRSAYIAPTEPTFAASRLLAEHRQLRYGGGPAVVRRLDDACRVLGISKPNFQKVSL